MSYQVTRSGRAKPRGSGWELSIWYLMRLTGIGLFITALAHYIIVHFVYDPAIQDSVWVDGPLGQPRPADDRLADAHVRPVPRLHGPAHRDR